MSSNALLFDLDLYDYDLLCAAAEDYRQLAHILVHQDGQTARCEFVKCVYDAELTVAEFSNYVLGLTVQKGAGNALG